MNRRGFVLAHSALFAGWTARRLVQRGEDQSMDERRVFVLVHGAWHGGWCWKWLAPMLREQGHEVYAPTMAGLGERGLDGRPRALRRDGRF